MCYIYQCYRSMCQTLATVKFKPLQHCEDLTYEEHPNSDGGQKGPNLEMPHHPLCQGSMKQYFKREITWKLKAENRLSTFNFLKSQECQFQGSKFFERRM